MKKVSQAVKPDRKTSAPPGPALPPWVLEAVLWLVLGVAVLVSLCPWDPGGVPDGLYMDEVLKVNHLSHYLATGHNMWDHVFPVYDQVHLALALPWSWVFGLSPASMRSLSVLMILVATLVFFRLVRHYVPDRRLALLAAILFFLSPSLLTVKRLIMEMNAEMLTVVVAWALWLRALDRATIFSYALGGLAWGVTAYSYTGARVMVVLYLGFLVVGSWRKGGSHRRALVGVGFCFLAMLVPFLLLSLTYPDVITGRFQQVSVSAWEGTGALLQQAPWNYLKIVGSFLWFQGDVNLRHQFGPGGTSYLAFLPLVAIGLWHAWKKRHDVKQAFLIWGFITGPLPTIVTIDPMHNLRTLHMHPFLAVLAIQGAVRLLDGALGKRLKLAGPILLALAFLQGAGLLVLYADSYREQANPYFVGGSFRVIRQARKIAGDRKLLVHPSVFVDNMGGVDMPNLFCNIAYGFELVRGDSGLRVMAKRYRYDGGKSYPPGTLVLLLGPPDISPVFWKEISPGKRRLFQIEPERDYRVVRSWRVGPRGFRAIESRILLLEKKQ
jgi:4-amino-4-deoxy-L-arabinose transferase-like glycosyltransferase